MNTLIFRFTALAGIAALVAGCASDGGLQAQAKLHDANQLKAGATLAHADVSPVVWPARDWWHRYGDAQLDQLVDEALATSPTMRMADARVRQAAAIVGLSESALSPQVGADAHLDRFAFPKVGDTPDPLAGAWLCHCHVPASGSGVSPTLGKAKRSRCASALTCGDKADSLRPTTAAAWRTRASAMRMVGLVASASSTSWS